MEYEREQEEAAAEEAARIGGTRDDRLDYIERDSRPGGISDEAWRPVEEAGGGESEGFEEAEAELIERAENPHGPSPIADAERHRRGGGGAGRRVRRGRRGAHGRGRAGGRRPVAAATLRLPLSGESSNGKTRAFEARYPGSSPGSPASEDVRTACEPLFVCKASRLDSRTSLALLVCSRARRTFMTGPPSQPSNAAILAVNMTDEDVMARARPDLRSQGAARPAHAATVGRRATELRVQGSAAVRWMILRGRSMGTRRQAQISIARLRCSRAPDTAALLDDE